MGFVHVKMVMVVVRANTRLLHSALLKRPKWILFVDSAAQEGFPGLREL